MNIWPFSTVAVLRDSNTVLRQNLSASASQCRDLKTQLAKAESALALAKADYASLRSAYDSLQATSAPVKTPIKTPVKRKNVK